MRKILLHTFAILISSLILVETIGVYLTKDICEPCGKSEITAQLIITELEIDDDTHESCEIEMHEQECCAHETPCAHNAANHEHHQEHHFYKNISVFLSANTTPELEAQALTLIAPLVALLLPTENSSALSHKNYNYKPKIPQEISLPLLCTFLI